MWHSSSINNEPLLFLLYIHDLPNASPVVDLIIHADDTNLFFSNNDKETFPHLIWNWKRFVNGLKLLNYTASQKQY